MAPPTMTGPRYNQFIQAPKVRVIDENGENLGVMYTREAFEQAQEVGLDLVEISPGRRSARRQVPRHRPLQI